MSLPDRYQQAEQMSRPMKVRTPDELMSLCIPVPESGCWIWYDTDNLWKGYARVTHMGKQHRAHRLMYTLTRGPIPDGLELDHLCRVRCCINPYHLEPVTSHVNNLRGVKFRSSPSHCRNGHPLTTETAVMDYRGSRCCLVCRKGKWKRSYQRQKVQGRAKARWQKYKASRLALTGPVA